MDERQAKFDMMEKDMIQMKQFIHNTNNMRELDKEYFKKESSRHSTFLIEMQMSINESVRAEIDTRVINNTIQFQVGQTHNEVTALSAEIRRMVESIQQNTTIDMVVDLT